MWDLILRAKRVAATRPILERVLLGVCPEKTVRSAENTAAAPAQEADGMTTLISAGGPPVP